MIVTDLADLQGDVLSRSQIYATGVTEGRLRANIAAGRWRALGRRAIALHTGVVSEVGRHWAAVIEAGSGALLDGASALTQAGLTGFVRHSIDVSIPRGSHRKAVSGVTVHYVAKRQPDELLPGLPRTRADIAVVRGAAWESSDARAATLMVMAAQQRLIRICELPETVDLLKPHWRPALIAGVAADIADGAQALHELDFGRLCARYRIPRPDRQIVRTTSRGRFYLDAGWSEIGLGVEIDGVQHHLGMGPVEDALRQNELLLTGDSVLRLPVLGLRVRERELMAQVRNAYCMFAARAAA